MEKAIGSYDNILVLKIGESQAPVVSLEASQSFKELLSLERQGHVYCFLPYRGPVEGVMGEKLCSDVASEISAPMEESLILEEDLVCLRFLELDLVKLAKDLRSTRANAKRVASQKPIKE